MFTDNTHYPDYKTEKQTTTYAFMAFQRPTLLFDTYCYVSIPNDPDPGISFGGTNYQGLETDFEFEVVDYDEENEVFNLQGRFNKGGAILRKATQMDMDNVEKGRMMEVLNETYQDTRWANQYIYGTTPAGTEVAVKLYDDRNMYVFAYDGRTDLKKDEFSYFNTEVDSSNDLSFPEPIDLGSEKITGIKSEGGRFSSFTTESGELVPLNIEKTPPGVPLEDLFGALLDGKMYNSFTTTGDVVAAMASGVTYDALNLMDKFLFLQGSFNLVSRYDQVYYITEEPDPADQTNTIFYMTMTMTPIGMGINFENFTSVTSFPTSTYRFKMSNIDWNTLTFKTDQAQLMDAGAREYYNSGVTKIIVDGLDGATLRLQWSDVAVSNGMVVELKSTDITAGTHADVFIPAAILTVR
jgi:hypothetical protein